MAQDRPVVFEDGEFEQSVGFAPRTAKYKTPALAAPEQKRQIKDMREQDRDAQLGSDFSLTPEVASIIVALLIGSYLINYFLRKQKVRIAIKDKVGSLQEAKYKVIDVSHKVKNNVFKPNPDELLKWHDLKEKGVITEEEFEEHKKRILK